MVKPCKIAASLSSLSTVIRTGVAAPTAEVGIPADNLPVQVENPPVVDNGAVGGEQTETVPPPATITNPTVGDGQQEGDQQGDGQQGDGQQGDGQQGENNDDASDTQPGTGGGADTGNCDCYLVEGKYPTYYKNYNFFDFRTLSQYVGTEPVHATSPEDHVKADYTSEYFTSGEFSEFFRPMQWNRTTDTGFFMQNSFQNLWISDNDAGDSETFLRMRSARDTGDWQSAAEFESKEWVDHASMRMFSRLSGDQGACGAMFTYWKEESEKDAEGNPIKAEKDLEVQESDIEMLTKEDPKIMHYVNHGPNKKYHEKPKMAAAGWNNFVEHRVDWTPGQTTWYVNSEELKSTSRNAPANPSKLIWNMWGEDGSWTSLMPDNGAAHQDIQYIEIAHGVTEEGQCSNVCKVENGQPGKPVASSQQAAQ